MGTVGMGVRMTAMKVIVRTLEILPSELDLGTVETIYIQVDQYQEWLFFRIKEEGSSFML